MFLRKCRLMIVTYEIRAVATSVLFHKDRNLA